MCRCSCRFWLSFVAQRRNCCCLCHHPTNDLPHNTRKISHAHPDHPSILRSKKHASSPHRFALQHSTRVAPLSPSSSSHRLFRLALPPQHRAGDANSQPRPHPHLPLTILLASYIEQGPRPELALSGPPTSPSPPPRLRAQINPNFYKDTHSRTFPPAPTSSPEQPPSPAKPRHQHPPQCDNRSSDALRRLTLLHHDHPHG